MHNYILVIISGVIIILFIIFYAVYQIPTSCSRRKYKKGYSQAYSNYYISRSFKNYHKQRLARISKSFKPHFSDCYKNNALKMKNKNVDYIFNGLRPYWMRSDGWMLALLWWSFFSYYVTGMSFLASMMVLYLTADNIGGKTEYILYSIIAATFTIVNFAVKPNKRYMAYRRAWARLDYEINSFTNNHFNVTQPKHTHDVICYSKLAEAVRLGEQDIERGDD